MSVASRDVGIELTDVCVEVYPVSRASTWKQVLLFQAGQRPEPVKIVNGANLRIGPGERVGFVGRNGAGKTSLVKTICGIYPPASGTRTVRGRIAPVISTTLGFDYELGAIDNIALTYAHLDRFDEFDRDLARKMVQFAELEGRERIPLKKLSAGQQARISFTTVLFMSSDILVLDEVLTTGDASFLAKAEKAMFEKIEMTPIVLIVSHELGRLRRLCTRCVWVEGGKIVGDGPADATIDLYEKANAEGRA